MHFPVYIPLFGYRVHPHLVLELVAYSAGFQLYLLLRRRSRSAVPFEQNMWIVVGCVFGALAGSKLLAWAESFPDYLRAWQAAPAAFLGGKTIVGGLLGGWAGVELAKKRLGVTRSTGDLFVFPLVLGMSIGRVGCFLTGLSDHTCGSLTSAPWAVDFGDGPRHPTQLYDIAFLLLLGVLLLPRALRPHPEGQVFRLFVLGYLAYRFLIEFLKPRFHPYLGLSAIQVACLAGVMFILYGLWRPKLRTAEAGAPEPATEAVGHATT